MILISDVCFHFSCLFTFYYSMIKNFGYSVRSMYYQQSLNFSNFSFLVS